MPNLRRSRANRTQKNTLAARLQKFRLDRLYTYQRLADLIGGVNVGTVRRACLGNSLTLLTAAKIERFLADVQGDRHAA